MSVPLPIRPAPPPAERWPAPLPPAPPRRTTLRRRTARGFAALVAAALVGALAALGLGIATGFLHRSTATTAPPAGDASAGTTARAYGRALAAAVSTNIPSVANIDVVTWDGQAGEASGVVVGPDGLLLTNRHVVGDALGIGVTLPVPRDAVPAGAEVVARGRGAEAATVIRVPGRVVATSRRDDLALVRVRLRGLVPVRLARDAAPALGTPVIAMGFPLALVGGPSVTAGVVSGAGRDVTGEDGSLHRGLIQTDAAINRGNSGGPLLDLSGRVVGIDTLAAEAGYAENVGFAVPASRIRALLARVAPRR